MQRWLVLVLFASLPHCAPRALAPTDATDADRDANVEPDALANASDGSDVVTTMEAGRADAGTPSCENIALAPSDEATVRLLIECVSAAQTTDAVAQSAIATAVGLVQSRGGFPVRAGRTVQFVYVRDAAYDREDDARSSAEDFALERRAEPLSVVGDFNNWRPEANAMTHHGHGLFTAELPLEVTAAVRWGYKFAARTAGPELAYFSDPQSRRFQYDSNGRISFVSGSPMSGHLEALYNVRSMRFAAGRTVYVYVPPGYEQQMALRVPVLYMHDGNNLFDPAQPRSAPSTWDADAVADREIAANRSAPVLIVGIENSDGRFDEYTHSTDQLSGRTVGGAGRDYLQFIVQTVKPLIDRRYRSQADRAHTAILGSSLGGLISYFAALEQPDVFAMYGGMSSTFGWGSFGGGTDTMLARFAMAPMIRQQNTRYFLDSGGGPGAGGACMGPGAASATDNYCETLAMRDLLVNRGVRTFVQDPDATMISPVDANIEHFAELGAGHNEAAWSRRFHRVLRFFFGPR